jgi:formylglycine-generating enzyme required for sulfatase activity
MHMSIRTSLFIFSLAALHLLGCVGVAVKPTLPAGENPPPSVDAALWKSVDTLVARLGDDDYHAREAAQKVIEALPASALEAVKASVERRFTDKEIKWRGEKAVAVLVDKPLWEKQPKEYTNSIGMKLVLIPAGEFLMGSQDTEKDRGVDEGPQHKVRISKAFYMGTTEVTQAQWKAVMGNNPSQFQGDDLPVETVSWIDCQEFLKILSAKGGKTYRLPTEAEWEYACRAGTTTRFNAGDEDKALNEVGWYPGNSESKTHPVGQKKPNAWGLYDMHGNVLEWCQDWYGGEGYYKSSPAVDPTGPAQSDCRLMRGGSLRYDPGRCRSASRYGEAPVNRGDDVGFRVVLASSSPRIP